MGQLSSKLRGGRGHLTYWCQGCEEPHSVTVRTDGDQQGPAWGFDGNLESPTFTPSVLIRSGHYVPGHKPGDPCWCSWNAEHPDDPGPACAVCHTFITAGRVQFLSDCTHPLAGQTLPLPDLPEHMRDDRSQDG